MLPAPAPNLVITDYAFARRAVDPHCLGPQADLPPFVHHQLFTRARQRRAPVLRDAEAPRDASFARRAEDRLLGPQRSLRLRHRLPDHAPHHRRRGVERGDQRHDRLGLRGGVRRNAGLRLLARQPPHRLPAFRRERSAADGDDALRRQTLQQGLFVQIPQGRGAQLRGQLWIADLETGARERIDTGEETDQYIPASAGRPTDGRGTTASTAARTPSR